ncbi:MAG: alanine racemase [Bacteroidota bacterium]
MHRVASTDKVVRATRAEIDIGAIQHNLRQVRSRVGSGVKIMSVVKANAYGHGILEVSAGLLDAGTDYLGVGILDEGVFLREHGIEAPILVFAPLFPEQAATVLDYELEATICARETAEVVNALSSSRGRRAAVHVKVDTGMGRLGVDYRESVQFTKFIASLPNLDIRGIYTHFATADERDKRFAHTQLNRFLEVASTLSNGGIDIPLKHCANSAAVLELKDSYFDMVRPGVLLYGYYPSHDINESLSIRRALSWRSRIGFLKTVEAGTPISYGRKYVTDSATTIATVPVGYADGLNRNLTNRGEVIIRGRRYPLVGTVCMDQVMVNLGASSNAKTGDDVTLIGVDGDEEITAWDIADKLGTVAYEICCAISDRVPRVYS